jgi:hypothetical protein
MCEPFHSVVQYPTDDDQGGDNQSRLMWGLGKIYDWGKKIGSFFHFSKLGSGHTESIEWAKTKHLMLPDDTRYETAWWCRQTRIDGIFNGGASGDGRYALACAEQYSRTVVTGDLGKFRRFFETSIEKSSRGYSYVEHFLDDMLTYQARDEVLKRCKQIWGTSPMLAFARHKKELTALLLGYTRKRNLLVPEWADDDRLWTVHPATQQLA